MNPKPVPVLDCTEYGSSGAYSGSSLPSTGYSLWRYSGGAWQNLCDSCASGFEPGMEPSYPGNYDGEVRKKYCTPAQKQSGPKSKP